MPAQTWISEIGNLWLRPPIRLRFNSDNTVPSELHGFRALIISALNNKTMLLVVYSDPSSSSSYFICQRRRRATRKAEAHHTLVAHYITIINVRIKHTTHISTYKHSKQVHHSTHYTLTHTQTQNNHLKWRPRSTLLVTVLLTVNSYKELITFMWYVHDYCSVILPLSAMLLLSGTREEM